jgi:hypothetical protein
VKREGGLRYFQAASENAGDRRAGGRMPGKHHERATEMNQFVGLADYARSIEQRVKMAQRRRLKP